MKQYSTGEKIIMRIGMTVTAASIAFIGYSCVTDTDAGEFSAKTQTNINKMCKDATDRYREVLSYSGSTFTEREEAKQSALTKCAYATE